MEAVCFTFAVVCFILSLVSFGIMRIAGRRSENMRGTVHNKFDNWALTGWIGFALGTGVLLFPATGVTRNSSNGFGNPGHLLGWLVGGFLVWCFGSVIVFKATKNRHRHGH